MRGSQNSFSTPPSFKGQLVVYCTVKLGRSAAVAYSLERKSTPSLVVGRKIQPRLAVGLLIQAARLAVTSTVFSPVVAPAAVPREAP